MNVNESTMKEFLKVYYNSKDLDGDQGFFTKNKETFWVHASDLDAVVEKAATLAENNEIWFNTVLHDKERAKQDYLCRNPGKKDRYARGSERTAKVVFGAFIDIDIAGPGHAENDLPASKEIALEFINGLPLKVTMIVDSGGGLHVYILFDEPFYIHNDSDRHRIKQLFLFIQKMVRDAGQERGWNLDFVGDLARMGRVPGTFNCKIPGNPREVRMISCKDSNRYAVEELEAKFFKELEPTVRHELNKIEQASYPKMTLIYEKCAWFRHSIDEAKILTEPEWFAQLGISSRCGNGREESHRISERYQNYSYEATETKINHALDDGGPRTCANIIELTADRYCGECEYKGHITSPIQLGYNQKGNSYEEKAKEIELLSQKAEDIIERIKAGDRGAHMEQDAINVFASLDLADPAEFARKYDVIKDCKVQLKSFKKSVEAEKKRQMHECRQESHRIQMFLEDSPFPEAMIPIDYEVSVTGVAKVRYQEDGTVTKQQITLKPVIITKRFQTIDNGQEQIELSWKTMKWNSVIVERSVIASSRKIVELADAGLPVHTVNSNEVVVYLAAFEAANYNILPCESITSHLGWQGIGGKYGFLVGDELYENAEDSEGVAIKFKGSDVGDDQLADAFARAGEFSTWQETIKKIKDYPAVMAALYASFCTVLLEILGCSNFVYELACRTSKGKTTALRIAGSVWGCPDERSQGSVIHSWNNTKVYVEKVSSILYGLPLLLDDTQQCKSPELISDIIYMVCNGRGCGRANPKGIDQTKPIKTVLLSTGEAPSTHMTNRGGTRGRVLEVTTKPFSAKHRFLDLDDGETIIKINQKVKSNFGYAGPMFVEYVLSNKDKWTDWKKLFRDMEAEFAKKADESEVAGRLAEYAAMIEITGGLVHEAQILPWEFENPMEILWPVVTSESADPDGDVSAERYVSGRRFSHSDLNTSAGIFLVVPCSLPLAVLESQSRQHEFRMSSSAKYRLLRKLPFTYLTTFSTLPLDSGSDFRHR